MSYAGDVSCQQVWEELNKNAKASLVDVRTTREWSTIGVPDLSDVNKRPLFNEWQMFPSMELNTKFAEQIDSELQQFGAAKDDPVFFLCRTGMRSQGAASALTALGYTQAFNILEGFEGPPDSAGSRGTVSGWQFDQLPWHKE